MEVELKLLITAHDAKVLPGHPLLKRYAASKPQVHQLADTYFDTPALDFQRCEAGLRVRRQDQHWVQTMKGGGGIDGALHRRHEWEGPVDGPQPDLALLRTLVPRKSAWGKLLRMPHIESSLTPIFTTNVTRTVWQLQLPQGDKIEFALDQGHLVAGDRQTTVSEIELELKAGDPLHLFDFALALQQDIEFHIGHLSKAQRGYALFHAETVGPTAGQAPAAVKATALTLSKRMSIEQVFQAIIANCMAQVQGNQSGVAAGSDAESLHQMRVGLRRLHSALGVFKDVLQVPSDLQQELDWLGQQLGAARDWDVLAGSTLPAVAHDLSDPEALSGVQQAVQAQAAAMHRTAAAAVDAPRYTKLILCFTRWVLACGWRNTQARPERKRLRARISKFAASTLRRDQRRLHQRAAKLHGATPTARHKVRIAAKKTRYATEFFQSLYPAKKVRPFVAALSNLQEALGLLNDAAIADHLLEQLQQDRQQTHLQQAIPAIRDVLTARVNGDDKNIRKLWKKFAPMKLPR
jgi:inorganic triphosphatase YgiF